MNENARPILLVEDNPMDLDLTCRAFARRHIANPIQTARDGEEALGFLERWEQGEPLPVLILLDLKLPKIEGMEVLRRLKAHARFRMIPVVVLTTSSDENDIREAYHLKANSYIVKPVDYDRFVEAADHIEEYWCQINQLPGY